MSEQNKLDDSVDFSLGLGGPLYHIYLRTGLAEKPLLLCKRRMFILSLFAWLPLFILAMIGGVAFSGVKVPFIYDVDVHVRFLISLPLLVYAELIAHVRLRIIVQQFLKCNIIGLNDRQRFHAIIASAGRLANSSVVEICIIIFVITAGHWISEKSFPLDGSVWHTKKTSDMMQFTLAGYWYMFISLPLFQFLLLRWYYRIAIWYRFLFQVSRLPLQLNSLHPDRAGGIGFLVESVYALVPLLLAHSVLLSGMILNRIWNSGATLLQFQSEIIAIMIFIMALPLVPMIFFILPLLRAKRAGTLAYDVVANRYVSSFYKKWIDSESKNNEVLLGTTDIQSLADLSNSYNVSSQMRILPFGRSCIIAIVILTFFPLLPLLFTTMPIEKILNHVVGIIF